SLVNDGPRGSGDKVSGRSQVASHHQAARTSPTASAAPTRKRGPFRSGRVQSNGCAAGVCRAAGATAIRAAHQSVATGHSSVARLTHREGVAPAAGGTRREAERCNPGTPIATVRRHIFGRIPEGTVIPRINRQAAVVGPMEVIGSRTWRNASLRQDVGLALHLTQTITGHATRVANGGTHGGAG